MDRKNLHVARLTVVASLALLGACGSDLATIDGETDPSSGGADLTALDQQNTDASDVLSAGGGKLGMACAVGLGSAPAGYRYVQCDLSGFKPGSWVGPCVNARSPDVYGGVSCYPPQQIQADGTWSVAFALLGGKTYDFATHAVRRGKLTRTVLVTTTAAISP